MSISICAAVAITFAAIWALVKRMETRLVLLTAGFLMAVIALDPMAAFKQFDKSMTNGGLIISICSAMGFTAVVSITRCDLHLVALLTKPLKKMGVLLLPLSMIITGIVAVAIPSTAGCCAAVGPTLIPLLRRSGFSPAMAAAAIVGSITPAVFNPGSAHNVFIAKLADTDVMSFIGKFSTYSLASAISVIVVMTVLCFVYRDYGDKHRVDAAAPAATEKKLPELPAKANPVYAVAPMIPVAILVCASIWAPQMKLSVATAMLIGTIYALAVTRTNPAEAVKRFFDGMGRGYANILGIIIAAGVFAAGLRAAGVIDLLIGTMTQASEIAKIGAAAGPFLMGLVTGSGDAATFAFNEAVTPHAAKFGLAADFLGYLAMLSGHFGRLSSPLAGGLILVAGIAGVSPIDIVKRTAPAMIITLIGIYFCV